MATVPLSCYDVVASLSSLSASNAARLVSGLWFVWSYGQPSFKVSSLSLLLVSILGLSLSLAPTLYPRFWSPSARADLPFSLLVLSPVMVFGFSLVSALKQRILSLWDLGIPSSCSLVRCLLRSAHYHCQLQSSRSIWSCLGSNLSDLNLPPCYRLGGRRAWHLFG